MAETRPRQDTEKIMTATATQTWPDVRGRFGPYGGRYVPETLVAPLEELERAYAEARADAQFQRESWIRCCAISPGGPRRCNLPRA